MPATNFSWTASNQCPIFHMFGAKRKNPAAKYQREATSEDTCPSRKRLRTESHIHSSWPPVIEGEESMEESEALPLSSCASNSQTLDSHRQAIGIDGNFTNLQCSLDPTTPSFIQVTNSRVPPILDPRGDHRINNNNNAFEMNNNVAVSNLNQNDMIMDLSDEVYTDATLPPFSLPCNPTGNPLAPGMPSLPATDAECEAVCNMVVAMEGEGAPNPQQYNTAYCDQYCIGGHRSPSSGTVRCLCKPSWEGLHDIRPYVSDYY